MISSLFGFGFGLLSLAPAAQYVGRKGRGAMTEQAPKSPGHSRAARLAESVVTLAIVLAVSVMTVVSIAVIAIERQGVKSFLFGG